MALAHILRLLKKFFLDVADGVDEANQLRRTMARRHAGLHGTDWFFLRPESGIFQIVTARKTISFRPGNTSGGGHDRCF